MIECLVTMIECLVTVVGYIVFIALAFCTGWRIGGFLFDRPKPYPFKRNGGDKGG